MYLIRMMNCAFFGRHGVLDEEETLGQRFYVDAIMTVDSPRALEDDAIDATVDYGVAFKVIEDIMEGGRRHLIEALAFQIGKALTARYPQISRAEITVRKPSAAVQGVLDHVEVTVAWPQ